MKIQCDVCNRDSAAFFCPADDAALCAACDRRVHQVNKLAGKHHRFSLLTNPTSSQQIPLCDVCQETRAFLFCQQDRAILCKSCDYSIHSASRNAHNRNHDRFLLTGINLSFDPSPSHSAVSAHTQPMIETPRSPEKGNGGGTSSSISEYFIERLPGWNVDDFLDSCSHTFDFPKEEEEPNRYISLWDKELKNDDPYRFVSVAEEEFTVKNTNFSKPMSKKWSTHDGSLAVPQISNGSNICIMTRTHM